MTTLTLNTHVDIASLFAVPPTHIPSFMEGSFGCASVLVRHKDDLNYDERWCKLGGHVDNAEEADIMEVVAYLNTGDARNAEDMEEHVHYLDFDTYETISVHDQDTWDECTDAESDTFVELHDYRLELQRAA